MERLRGLIGPRVKSVSFSAETDSTNLDARSMFSKGEPIPFVVVTDHQSAGRGRLDRTWYSAPGLGVLLSIAAGCSSSPQGLGAVPFIAGLAARSALSNQAVEATLKWPNDVLAGGRKIAGCLVEIVARDDNTTTFVAGVGINANNPHLPQEVEQVATSLLLETGNPADREKLAADLVASFMDLLQLQPPEVLALYRDACDTIGRPVKVELAGSAVEGTATGVDDHGRLLLDSGEVLYAGDVVHVGQKLG